MSTVDERAVEEARRQILAIVDQIRALAQGDMKEAEFFAALLAKAVEAMGAVGGIVWLVRDQGRVESVSGLGVEHTGLTSGEESQAAHGKLVSMLLGNPEGIVVPPRAGLTKPDGSPAAENPTDLLVVAAPIERAGTRAGLIEVFHHSNAPDVERGYLKFLEQAAQPAGLYLERQQLVTLDSQQTALVQVDRFSRAVHESLDPKATAYVLANEARRIIGCDRVSVLVSRGRKLELTAVSGQESIERRASAVQAIEALVRVVARAGDPLWHPDPSRELPPQIEEELEAYIDESHATALAIVPLEKPRPTPVVKAGGIDAVAVAKAEAAPKVAPRPIGALVAEWFSSASFEGGRRARVELVAEHGKVALANALAHTGLPLFPVLDILGRSRVLTSARNLPKTVLAALSAVAAVAALVLVPADLRLEGKGTLEPVHRRDVFAGIDGVVESIAPGVEHGAEVKEKQLLATLRNIELDVALTDVLGRKAGSEEQLVSTRRALLEDQKISADEKNRMAGRAAQLEREIESLEEQRKLYEAKKLDLAVRSPIDGVIVTWQVRDRLMLRPVEKGQVLLNVADKTGPWELEIHLPDDRLGHVNRAVAEAKAAGRELTVDYILATDPGTRHAGSVREIHEQAEVRGEQGNTVLVRVTIDPSRHAKEELGAGASVTARINCGTRPLGYVIFHDLVAFVQQHILFRLW
ncbi:MAG: HlyD family efflux transporter periplasmic adaptor subunit [Planctomycetia bacterium]|nr:HlyD family efflux transporter periplasmic adaptor subunit [Planctomycetia bacterium]